MSLTNPQRKIIHIDMDCFYAAIEIRNRPELSDKPVAVGGAANSRGVLCTCNYMARKFGLHSAMPSSRALELCPQLILLPVNMSLYKQVSQRIMQLLATYSPKIEPLSLDEAYLDVTNSSLHNGSATLIAREIQQQIWQHEQLTASAGVAPNKFLAKIASAWHKPNGLCVISPKQVTTFIQQLAVNKLFGVGKITAAKLNALHIYTCQDLQAYSLTKLQQLFGKFGQTLYYQARGIDNREVLSNRPRKSLSVERTFNLDLTTFSQIELELALLQQELIKRLSLLNYEVKIKAQVIKLKLNNFKQYTSVRSCHDLDYHLFQEMLKHLWQQHPQAVRLLGIGVNFTLPKNPQPELF